jgi:hypothetical protein
MMAVEGPFLAALIARLPEPKYNLAAFGVALSFALIVEAPVIMIMGAATALVRGRDSFRRMRRFTYTLNAAVTACMAVVLIPPVYRVLTAGVLGLPEEVGHLTYGAAAWLLPWPGVIGYRRLYQGILIRKGLTRRVGYGTIFRLLAMSCGGLALVRTGLDGALVGGAALCAGVVAEAAAVRWMVRSSLAGIRSLDEPPGPPLTYRAISTFYYPLALSSLLTLVVHPLATLFLAQGRSALESLAVFPVVRSLVFLFSCLGLSYQEVGIALLGDGAEGYRLLRRFALALGLAASAGLALIAFTPLSEVWYVGVSGLNPGLAAFALGPTRLLAVVPGLTVLLCFLRAVLVHERRTRPITAATVVEVAGIAGVLHVGIHLLDVVGIYAGAVALVVGRAASTFTLVAARGRLRRREPSRLPGPDCN